MADQFTQFMEVFDALEKYDVEYILIGGVAVVLQGMERLTRDIDIFVKMAPENIDLLKKALNAVFDDPSINEINPDMLQNYPVVRYGAPNGLCIDLIVQLGEAASYPELKYETIEYQGTKIRLATPETLYHLKKDTVRDKDRMDALFLKELIRAKKDKK